MYHDRASHIGTRLQVLPLWRGVRVQVKLSRFISFIRCYSPLCALDYNSRISLDVSLTRRFADSLTRRIADTLSTGYQIIQSTYTKKRLLRIVILNIETLKVRWFKRLSVKLGIHRTASQGYHYGCQKVIHSISIPSVFDHLFRRSSTIYIGEHILELTLTNGVNLLWF